MAKEIIPQNTDSAQDSNASIVAMLDEILLDDNLSVVIDQTQGDYTQYLLVDISNDNHGFLIDTYETRAAAYRAAIDCVIEYSIEAWEQGGTE